MRLTDAIRRYLNALLAEGRSRHTIRGAKSALKQIAVFLEGIDVREVAELDQARLLRYRPRLAPHAERHTPQRAKPARAARTLERLLSIPGGSELAPGESCSGHTPAPEAEPPAGRNHGP